MTVPGAEYPCVIVGAGPAGLSAALVLGRCRRRVLVCDDGRPRNAVSQAGHGFLTRDGTPPAEMRRLAREQLQRYETIELRQATVTDARRTGRRFTVTLEDQSTVSCRKLLLATGLVDELPAVPGIQECYGRSVFHCPYCDGWEFRDRALAVCANGKAAAALALNLSELSRDVVLCTNGPCYVMPRALARLQRRGIALRCERIVRLEGDDGRLRQIVFAEGPPLEREAIFVHTLTRPRSDLAARLGCRREAKRAATFGAEVTTALPGLYVAGDALREVQLSIAAAAQGAQAAVAIHQALLREDLAASRRD
jgi:thioredoxin reductase